jgi:hypothetical protein
MPTILSVDVGIKNLSFCLLKVTESLTIEILKWNTLNLSDADNVKLTVKPSDVHCTTKAGCKLKPAYFYIDGVTNADTYACKRHYKKVIADTRREFELKPAYISKVLKTFTLEKMRDFCAEHSVTVPDNVKTKSDFRAVISDIFKKKYVYPADQRDVYASLLRHQPHGNDSVVPLKTTAATTTSTVNHSQNTNANASASTVSLVFVGYNLMKMFDALFYENPQTHDISGPAVHAIDTVVIENQISPIANRMKTVQGMITQYFLMRGVDKCRIIYFSAVQKLKVAPYHFVFHNSNSNKLGVNGNDGNHDDGHDDADEVDDIQTYDERKKAGVACVRKILSNANPLSGDAYSKSSSIFSVVNTNTNWLQVFESHSKKDDMADAFLQGLSYIVKTENKCESKTK